MAPPRPRSSRPAPRPGSVPSTPPQVPPTAIHPWEPIDEASSLSLVPMSGVPVRIGVPLVAALAITSMAACGWTGSPSSQECVDTGTTERGDSCGGGLPQRSLDLRLRAAGWRMRRIRGAESSSSLSRTSTSLGSLAVGLSQLPSPGTQSGAAKPATNPALLVCWARFNPCQVVGTRPGDSLADVEPFEHAVCLRDLEDPLDLLRPPDELNGRLARLRPRLRGRDEDAKPR